MFKYPCGRQGGIRTHGGFAPTLVFKTSAFDHSATCPRGDAASDEFATCHPPLRVEDRRDAIRSDMQRLAVSTQHAFMHHFAERGMREDRLH